MNDIKPQDIEALIDIFEASSWDECRLKIDGLDLFLSKRAGAAPPPALTPAAALASPQPAAPRAIAPPPARTAAIPDGWIAVKAPHLGSFYRAPKPGAAPYVELGQRVEATTEICLIEVMKLFTSIVAGASGVVRKILAEDAELVEYDQPLFLIEPDA